MKHFILISFALFGLWLISNPYNWPVLTQYITLSKWELIYDNVGPARKEAAARILLEENKKYYQLILMRDSVQ